MNNFITLSKAFFLNMFGMDKRTGKNKGLKVLIFLGILFIALSFLYNYEVIFSLSEMEISYESYLLLVLSAASMLTIVLFIFQVQGSLFKTKDYEMLESLPLKRSEIIGARLFSLYLLSLLEDAIIIVPALIYYLYFTGNLYVAFIVFIAMFFVSFIPLLISSLVGSTFTYLSSKFKHSNVVNIVLYLVFFVLIMAGSFYISFNFGAGEEIEIPTLPWFVLIEKAFNVEKWYLLLVFILMNALGTLLVIAFVSKIYPVTNNLLSYSQKGEAYVSKELNIDSVDKELLRKEYKQITSSPIYFVNSFLGPIFLLVMNIVFIFVLNMVLSDPEIIEEAMLDPSVIDLIFYIMLTMIPTMGILMNSVATSTSTSISLEGENFEALKSYPIEPKKILNAKIKAGMTIPLVADIVFSFVTAIIVYAMFKPSIGYIIEIALLPVPALILIVYIGLLCNLKWQKFDFAEINQVLKNSMSPNMTVLFGFIPTIIITSALFGFNIINPMMGAIISLTLYIIFDVVVIMIYNKTATEKFNKIIG